MTTCNALKLLLESSSIESNEEEEEKKKRPENFKTNWMNACSCDFVQSYSMPARKKTLRLNCCCYFILSVAYACMMYNQSERKKNKKDIDIIAICWNAEMPFCCCRRCFHSSFSLALYFSMSLYRHFRMRFICKFHMNLRSWWCCLLFANSYSHSVLSIAIACIGCELCRRA